jgi:hypothetical protein
LKISREAVQPVLLQTPFACEILARRNCCAYLLFQSVAIIP